MNHGILSRVYCSIFWKFTAIWKITGVFCYCAERRQLFVLNVLRGDHLDPPSELKKNWESGPYNHPFYNIKFWDCMISCITSSSATYFVSTTFALFLHWSYFKHNTNGAIVLFSLLGFRYCSQQHQENHYNVPEKVTLAVLSALLPGGHEFDKTQEFSTLCYIIQLTKSNRHTLKIAREDNPTTRNKCIVLTKLS